MKSTKFESNGGTIEVILTNTPDEAAVLLMIDDGEGYGAHITLNNDDTQELIYELQKILKQVKYKQ
jgi:hypothetical protein